MTRTKLVAGVALVGLLAAYWFMILAPKREQIAKLDQDVTTAQSELSQAEATLATYQKAQLAYRGNYSTVVRLGKAVPADDDVRSLVVQLDSAAERSGVDFTTIDVGGATAGPKMEATPTAGAIPPPPGAVSVGEAGFTAMPFTFAFNGRFSNLSTFFSRLEHFVTVSNKRIGVTGRLLRLESMSLKPDGDGFPRIRAEIGASSYLLPSSQGATAGATADSPVASTGAAGGKASPSTPSTPPTTTATTTGAIR